MTNNQHHDGDGMTHQNLMGASGSMYPNQLHYPMNSSGGSEQQHGMTASMMMPLSTTSSQIQQQNNGSAGLSNNGLMHQQLLHHQAHYYGSNGMSDANDPSQHASGVGLLGEEVSEEDQDHFRDVISLAAQPDADQQHSSSAYHTQQLQHHLNSANNRGPNVSMFGAAGNFGDVNSLLPFKPFPVGAMGGAAGSQSDPLLGQYLSVESAPSTGMFGSGASPFNLLGGSEASGSLLSGYLDGGGTLLPQHYHPQGGGSGGGEGGSLMSNAAAADMLNRLNGDDEEEEGDDEDLEDLEGEDDEDDGTLDDNSREQLLSALVSGSGFNALQQTANSVFQQQQQQQQQSHHQNHMQSQSQQQQQLVFQPQPNMSSSGQNMYRQQHSQQPFQQTASVDGLLHAPSQQQQQTGYLSVEQQQHQHQQQHQQQQAAVRNSGQQPGGSQ
jgi:hypothetical protein